MMSTDSSATGIAVGVSLAIVTILLLGAVGFVYMHRKRRNEGFSDLEEEGRPSMVLERSHPASRAVTPFGVANNDTPRFSTYERVSIECTKSLNLISRIM